MEDQKQTDFESKPLNQSNTKKENIWDLVRFVVIAMIIVLPIRILIAQPFIVSGSSMFPTFEDKQYLIVDQISYRFEEPARGEVIIFRYPLDPSKFFIKRVIGLPNETVKINNGKITIHDSEGNDINLDEPYLQLDRISSDDANVELGDDEYFVMGDNRIASSDSRTWGVLPRENVIGKALIRLLPVDTLEIHPGEHHFTN